MQKFKAKVEIIGINPFVFVPEPILNKIFDKAKKNKGHIPIYGTVNEKKFTQTLVKYSGEWRLYINTTMLERSPKRVGEIIEIAIDFDPKPRTLKLQPKFVKALNENHEAKTAFKNLPASRQKEIARYISSLKTEESIKRNIEKAVEFLLGKSRFAGRDKL